MPKGLRSRLWTHAEMDEYPTELQVAYSRSEVGCPTAHDKEQEGLQVASADSQYLEYLQWEEGNALMPPKPRQDELGCLDFSLCMFEHIHRVLKID